MTTTTSATSTAITVAGPVFTGSEQLALLSPRPNLDRSWICPPVPTAGLDLVTVSDPATGRPNADPGDALGLLLVPAAVRDGRRRVAPSA